MAFNKKYSFLFGVFIAPLVYLYWGYGYHVEKINFPILNQTLSSIENYLEKSEEQYSDLRPNVEKKVIWHEGQIQRREISIVYIHGFSASRREISPLVENLGKKLQANIFFTRLKGHGRSGEAMGDARVRDWLGDANEALSIGRILGKKVIVIGYSTGAMLSLWLGLQKGEEIHSLVLLAPNFAPRDKRTSLLLLPGGEWVVQMLVGTHREWKAENSEQEKYWTTRYPSSALIELMGLLFFAQRLPLESISVPLFMAYNQNDNVIDLKALQKGFERIRSHKKLVHIPGANRHFLAGEVMSSETTNLLAQKILSFLKPLIQ